MKEKKQAVKVVHVTMDRRIPLSEKTCPQCEQHFMGMRIQRYCSKRCANLAAYWRNPDTYRRNSLESVRRRKQKDEGGKR